MIKFAKIIGYPLLFLIMFSFFIYYTFPFHIFKDKVSWEIERFLGKGYRVNIAHLEPEFLLGAMFENLVIEKLDQGKNNQLIQVKKAYISKSLFSSAIDYSIQIGRGEIDGWASINSTSLDLNLECDELSLNDVGWVKELSGFLFHGRIDGDIELDLDLNRISRSNGNIAIDLKNIEINDIITSVKKVIAKQNNPMLASVPAMLNDMNITRLVLSQKKGSYLKGKIRNGVLQLEGFRLTQGDIELELRGRVTLNRNPNRIRFSGVQGYISAGEKMENLLSFVSVLGAKKDQQGRYKIELKGSVNKLDIRIGGKRLPL